MAKFPMQEQETILLKPTGLWTYPNALSAVPQGALSEALNVIMSRPNVLTQRRGINKFGTVLSNNTNKFYNYQNRVIINHGTTLSYDSDGAGTWVDYAGSYSPPTGAIVIRSFQANKNLYFLTSTGAKKLAALTGTIVPSGAPAGLDGSGSTTGSGWFTSHTQVAYRITFLYTDANGNEDEGAPSQRIVVANNTASPTNVSLTFTLPAGLTTAWTYQVYRSPMSADLNTEPNDECALVYTGTLSAGDLSTGTVTITDSIDDSLKGAFIYTASSQEGLSQSNYQPPISTDATTFKGITLYANTMGLQQLQITLVSVGSPNGVQNGDTITIDGVVYTGASSETISTGTFQVFTGGTPSQNITNTANSLVRVINRYASNTTIYAYYTSGYSDLPGQILLSKRTLGTSVFNSISTRGAAFVPNLTASNPSVALTEPNVVYPSKQDQPEAVPIGGGLPIGSGDKAILRIIALRDYVLIFKQDGVFKITGDDVNSLAVSLVDESTILQGIETAVALNNKVFLFSSQSVVSMSVNEGAVLKSQPIKQDLLVLSSPQYPAFSTVSYGIAYESENQYILGTVTNTTDTTCTQFYVYNYLTDTWTTWQFPFTMGTGFVNPTDNKLYFGSSDASSHYVYQERKSFTEFDYADDSYAVNITGFTNVGTTYTVNLTSTTNVRAGYTLSQADRKVLVLSVVDSTHITVDAPQTWSNGAATVYTPINVVLKFVPEACGNPGLVKHFKECHAIFSVADFDSFDLGFYTDFYSAINFSTLVPKISTGWGAGPWGEFPWGSGAPELQVIRGYVPLPQRRGHWLNITVNYSNALSNFALDGFVLFHQSMAQKFH